MQRQQQSSCRMVATAELGRQQSTVMLEYLYYDWVGDTSSIGISGISYIMIIFI